jgi:hypothetical protein
MAGKIIADIIEAPAGRISLNVGNTVVATMNASGLYTSTGNLLITQANQIGTAALPAGTVVQAKSAASDTVITCTSGAAAQEVVGLDFTPQYSNSIIYIVAHSGQTRRTGFSTAVANWGNFFITIGGGTGANTYSFSANISISNPIGAMMYPLTEQDARGHAVISGAFRSWSGSKRIAALGSMGSNEGSFSFCFQNQPATMFVLEIKQ